MEKNERDFYDGTTPPFFGKIYSVSFKKKMKTKIKLN